MDKKKLTRCKIEHIAVNLIAYSSVFFISDTGSAIFILIILIPFILAINSTVYGARAKSFDLIYPVVSTIVFLPFVFIAMNESALVYAPAYLVIMLIFSGLSSFIAKKKKK